MNITNINIMPLMYNFRTLRNTSIAYKNSGKFLFWLFAGRCTGKRNFRKIKRKAGKK